jgi:hypothetical protein
MDLTRRNFLISNRHKRLQRLWQFFFAGWGLIITVALVAGALLNNAMLWTPITDLLMSDIVENQFRMTDPSFAGTDQNGNPFSIRANVAYQEYGDNERVFLEMVNASIMRADDKTGKMTNDKIRADNGVYDKSSAKITLTGNIAIDSDTGDKIRTNEMVIKL